MPHNCFVPAHIIMRCYIYVILQSHFDLNTEWDVLITYYSNLYFILDVNSTCISFFNVCVLPSQDVKIYDKYMIIQTYTVYAILISN